MFLHTMDEEFPNPFAPKADEARPSDARDEASHSRGDGQNDLQSSCDGDDDLARALRESLAVQEDDARKRQAEEDALLEAALRASEADHAREQREKAAQQRRIAEIIEESRREAYRERRRREAEQQRHAILEMEIMEQSRREHEQRQQRMNAPMHIDLHERREPEAEMEELLWLRSRQSISTPGSTSSRVVSQPESCSEASAIPAPALAPPAFEVPADSPPKYEDLNLDPALSSRSMESAGQDASRANRASELDPSNPHRPEPYESNSFLQNPFPDTYHINQNPVPVNRPHDPLPEAQSELPESLFPAQNAPTNTILSTDLPHGSETQETDLSPTDPGPTPRTSLPLSRYEQMFGRYDSEDEPEPPEAISHSPKSPWSSDDEESQHGHSATEMSSAGVVPVAVSPPNAAERLLAVPSPRSHVPPSSVPAAPSPPVAFETHRPAPSSSTVALPHTSAAVPPLMRAPATPGSTAVQSPVVLESPMQASAASSSPVTAAQTSVPAFPPDFCPGQPALRGVQFGVARHAYAVALTTPSGAPLYPTPDLAAESCMPPHQRLVFPDTIDLATQPYFVVRTYSWKLLLQAMAWHGKTVVTAPRGKLYLHVAISVPRRSDNAAFMSPSFAALAFSSIEQPLVKSPQLEAFCREQGASLSCVSLVAHPLGVPTDLVTLTQTLFSAPQLSHAPALRELRQVIAAEDEWLDARAHHVPASSTASSPLNALEQQCIHQQLSLHQHPLMPVGDTHEAPHREHFRERVRRTFSRWNASNVAPDEDLAAWITPYDVSQ